MVVVCAHEIMVKYSCLPHFLLLLLLTVSCLENTLVNGKDAESEITDSVSSCEENSIGPELTETCDITDCTTTPPTPITPTGSAESNERDLALTHSKDNLFQLIYGSVSSAISTVYRTGNRIYSTVQNSTSDFVEAVREVLREEFFNLVINGFTNVVDTATAPG